MNEVDTAQGSTRRQSQRPQLHLIITNISKKNNVRALLQSAASFGCASVLVVGQKTFSLSANGNCIPQAVIPLMTSGRISILYFEKWDDCVKHLKLNNIRLVGVEIHDEAKLIEHYFDYQDTAFLMGNEGEGIQEKQMKSCDAFVRIPQYGDGTASLNVYVAASIVLHRYHRWQRSCGDGEYMMIKK